MNAVEELSRYKFPRTPHLSFSPGRSSDDIAFQHEDWFEGQVVVVSEKMDGENITIYSDGYCHARSIDGRHHPSRSWMKNKAPLIANNLAPGFRLCLEYMYARHTIAYEELSSFFYIIGIFDDKNYCLSWEATEELAELFGIPLAPVLYCGEWDEKLIRSCFTGKSKLGGKQEGYVVRTIDTFHHEDYARNVAKFVSDEFRESLKDSHHWAQKPVVPNKLKIT